MLRLSREMSTLLYLVGVTLAGVVALLAQLEGGDPQDWRSHEMAVFHLPPDRSADRTVGRIVDRIRNRTVNTTVCRNVL